MFNHGDDFLKKEKKKLKQNSDKDINLIQWRSSSSFLNFSNDLVHNFFGKMSYLIDSLLGFSL
jgi:hypothetical protein